MLPALIRSGTVGKIWQVTNGTNDREQIVAAVQRIAAANGEPPGVRKLRSDAGIKPHQWERFWARYSDLLAEAGFTANEFQQAYPSEKLLETLARLTRETGRFPTHAALRVQHCRDSQVPDPGVFTKRFRTMAAMVEALREWVLERPEWSDVLSVLSAKTSARDGKQPKPAAGPSPPVLTELSDSFIPPVIASLPNLARGELFQSNVALELEFERRVGAALAILGLTVEQLGQGSGRVADGIARCASENWAVIFDAKVRTGGYRLGTEDRKFREYVETHMPSFEGRDSQRLLRRRQQHILRH